MAPFRDKIANTPILRAILGFVLVFAVTSLAALMVNGQLWGALITSLGMAVYFYFRGPRKQG
jgi:hypothetical protein